MNLAALARPINRNGLAIVKGSIKRDGYSLVSRKPSVLVPAEIVEGRELTADLVNSLSVRVLDGNHRIYSLRELYGPDYAIDVFLYKSFDDPQVESVLAAGTYILHLVSFRNKLVVVVVEI